MVGLIFRSDERALTLGPFDSVDVAVKDEQIYAREGMLRDVVAFRSEDGYKVYGAGDDAFTSVQIVTVKADFKTDGKWL